MPTCSCLWDLLLALSQPHNNEPVATQQRAPPETRQNAASRARARPFRRFLTTGAAAVAVA